MLKKMRNSQGFTLIELLIVVAIIGILAAIAIPQFSKYRMQGYNASGNSDMRNLRTSEESMFADWQRYGRSDVAAALPGAGGFGPGAAVLVGPGTPAALNLITSNDVNGTARGLQVAIGQGIRAVANSDAATGATYTIVTKHDQADTMYAADADSTANFKLQYNAVGPVGHNVGVQLVLADCPVALITSVEFTAAASWVAM